MNRTLARACLVLITGMLSSAFFCNGSGGSPPPNWSFEVVTNLVQSPFPPQPYGGAQIIGSKVQNITGMQGSVGSFNTFTNYDGHLRFNDTLYVPAVWNIAMYTANCNGYDPGNQAIYPHDTYTLNCPAGWVGPRSGGFALDSVPSDYWNVQQPAPAPPSPGSAGTMTANTYLYPGDRVYSPDGSVSLDYQGDGNLVLYRNGSTVLWAAGTNWGNAGFAVMAGDGNCVLYDQGGNPYWWTGTQGNSGAYLGVSNSGGFVIYRSDSTAAWWTGTGSL